jgi:hypothetical protein
MPAAQQYDMAPWFPIVAPLIGVVATVIGWSLNQLGQTYAFRRERKKAMARALYGMLQIRDRIRLLPEAVRMLSAQLQIPAATQVLLMAVMENFFFVEGGFAKEFEESLVRPSAPRNRTPGSNYQDE